MSGITFERRTPAARSLVHALCSALTVLMVSFGAQRTEARPMSSAVHLVAYFEIPVVDMERAIAFYEAVFEVTLERRTIDGYDMALFAFEDGAPGATGALAKGDVYVPSTQGVIVYFRVADIAATVERAKARGAGVLYEVKDVGEFGLVAEILDSEGNRIALNQPR
ncbi:MAG: VOC family protein [Silanimonas sp.]